MSDNLTPRQQRQQVEQLVNNNNNNNNNNNDRRRVVAIGLLALITIIISIVYSSHFSTAAISQKVAEEIKMAASKRYTENFAHLNKRDQIAQNIITRATSSYRGTGHPVFASPVLLRNFHGNTSIIKKFMNEDIVPYISRFAENTKQPAQECVHYLTPEEKKDSRKFAAVFNPVEGCSFRVVVDVEVSDNTRKINNLYKPLLEGGSIKTAEEIQNIRRFANAGDRLLVVATTKYDKTDEFMDELSAQMFGSPSDAGGAF